MAKIWNPVYDFMTRLNGGLRYVDAPVTRTELPDAEFGVSVLMISSKKGSIHKGGTLEILRSCLEYLSGLSGEYRIVALVHDKALCEYQGIEYMEFPTVSDNPLKRLWIEYVSMKGISRRIASGNGERQVYLWLSLHDFTPNVAAEHREVYMQTSFPFIKAKLQDLFFDPKLALIAISSGLVYRINARKNDSIIVQQNWFADAMARKLHISREKFRVIPPSFKALQALPAVQTPVPTFLYVSTPDIHKNFETLCRAAVLLCNEGLDFKVLITVKGTENRYARYLKRKWGSCKAIDFLGQVPKEELPQLYAGAFCFVFPSRIETWGLPISEYMSVNPEGQLILADLPYAHDTSNGRGVYFPCCSPKALACCMRDAILSLQRLPKLPM